MNIKDKNKPKKAYIKLFESVVDTILPPRCPGSGEVVEIQGAVSPNFWDKLQFIEKPFCKKCSIPFSFESDENVICGRCLDEDPFYDESRAAVVYNDASRRVILNFKFNDKTHYVHTFVPWMLRAGKELIEQSDYIIPVPLHPKKIRMRKFNQSALLAQAIAKKTNVKYLPDGLIRTRHTIPQKGLNKKQRLENISGAFEISDNYLDKLAHKNILIIDDIFTTGATLNECARILKNAGSCKVSVLTIARVTKEEFV